MWTSFNGPRSSAKRNTSSITCSPRGSSIQEPQDQRYDPTNDEAGHDREIETEIPPFDHDVARQMTEPESRPSHSHNSPTTSTRPIPINHRLIVRDQNFALS